jgi:predicted RecB family nuclease
VSATVLLDAAVVTRCRRRVHLEHDPDAGCPPSPPDPTGEQRRADAATHRRSVAGRLAASFGAAWSQVPPDGDRAAATAELLASRTPYIWGAVLPADRCGHRRGHAELLVAVPGGYLPVIVVRHKVTDPGMGALTSPLSEPVAAAARPDTHRRPRAQPRDQLRLAHLVRLLGAAGLAPPGRAFGGVIGLDADVVLWHDLDARSWPGGRSALAEYDARFADRLAIAHAALLGKPALARPSRVTECRGCPWWQLCETELRAGRDVSLVLRGEDAVALRAAGVSTVDALAGLDPAGEPPAPLAGMTFADAVLLSRAWLADHALVRRRPVVEVPRADVELDVDMESFGDAGAYLWGCWLSGAEVGLAPGYRAFVTWRPLPTTDEARSFAEFWAFLATVRGRAAARGLTFRAFCYNELAENRWLIASAQRFAGRPGVPEVAAVEEFIASSAWVDLFGAVREQFLCAHGKGLKTIAPAAGFAWRDPEAGGENSMRWYRAAVGLDGAPPNPAQRDRLLHYNEDDVRATFTLRRWMSSAQVLGVPYAGDL